MTHRNTPCQDTGVSPAEMLYGYRIRDHLPNKYRTVRREWSDVKKARELRTALNQEKMIDAAGKKLSQLEVGDSVHIQNQTGCRPRKWNNSGRIVKVLPHRQYGVVIDGSRRVTLRNRKFLRKAVQSHRCSRTQRPAIVVSGMPAPIVHAPATPTPDTLPAARPITTQAVSPATNYPRTVPLPDSPTTPLPTISPHDAIEQPDNVPLEENHPNSPLTQAPVSQIHQHDSALSPERSRMTNRTRRAIRALGDYNKRGLKESPVAVEDAAPLHDMRRSSRVRKAPDRYDNK